MLLPSCLFFPPQNQDVVWKNEREIMGNNHDRTPLYSRPTWSLHGTTVAVPPSRRVSLPYSPLDWHVSRGIKGTDFSFVNCFGRQRGQEGREFRLTPCVDFWKLGRQVDFETMRRPRPGEKRQVRLGNRVRSSLLPSTHLSQG